MKKQISRYMALASVALSCVGASAYTINGNVSALKDGSEIEIYGSRGDGAERFAIDTISDGHFHFSVPDSLRYQKVMLRYVDPDTSCPHHLELYVEKGADYTITGNDNILEAMHVETDSPLQKTANRFTEICRDDIIAESQLRTRYRQTSAKLRSTSEGTPEFGSLSQLADSIEDAITRINTRQYTRQASLLDKMEVNNVWLDYLYQFTSWFSLQGDSAALQTLAEAYRRIPDAMLATERGHALTRKLFPPKELVVGDKAACVTLTNFSGIPVNLGEQNGRYMLLDFWSSACGACVASLPELKEVGEAYADKIAIVSINLDPEDWWRRASETYELKENHGNLNDPDGRNGLALDYGINGYPSYVLIGPDGIIIDKWVGYRGGLIKEKLAPHIQ